jgi:hypothetical protein
MTWFASCKKAGKYLLLGTGLGLAGLGSYNTYQKMEYQHGWSQAEDARQKVSHPKIKTRLEEIQELKKRKEYDLVIIGTFLHYTISLLIRINIEVEALLALELLLMLLPGASKSHWLKKRTLVVQLLGDRRSWFMVALGLFFSID